MKRKKNSWLFKIAVLVFAVYSLYTIITLQIDINAQKEQRERLQQQIDEQAVKNAEYQAVLDEGLSDEYIERIARDKLGLAHANERIFINPDHGD